MDAKWRRVWGMLAVVLCLAPLVAIAQPQPREPRSNSSADQPRGAMQVVNDWQDEVSLSVWSENRERLGEWLIRPGENVALQERGERIRVHSNYKIKLGADAGWVDVGEVGQLQNGVWHVNVRNVWAATHHQDRPEGRDSRRGEAPPKETSPRGEESPLDQILKRIK